MCAFRRPPQPKRSLPVCRRLPCSSRRPFVSRWPRMGGGLSSYLFFVRSSFHTASIDYLRRSLEVLQANKRTSIKGVWLTIYYHQRCVFKTSGDIGVYACCTEAYIGSYFLGANIVFHHKQNPILTSSVGPTRYQPHPLAELSLPPGPSDVGPAPSRL